MAIKYGLQLTCDRCGVKKFFEANEDGEIDDDYIRLDTFEEKTGWTTEYRIGNLCPECSQLFKSMREAFLSNFKNAGVVFENK